MPHQDVNSWQGDVIKVAELGFPFILASRRDSNVLHKVDPFGKKLCMRA